MNLFQLTYTLDMFVYVFESNNSICASIKILHWKHFIYLFISLFMSLQIKKLDACMTSKSSSLCPVCFPVMFILQVYNLLTIFALSLYIIFPYLLLWSYLLQLPYKSSVSSVLHFFCLFLLVILINYVRGYYLDSLNDCIYDTLLPPLLNLFFVCFNARIVFIQYRWSLDVTQYCFS